MDPYAIRDFTGAHDQHLFRGGEPLTGLTSDLAHLETVNCVSGVGFAVWAPNAEGGCGGRAVQ